MANQEDIKRYYENLQDEINTAYLYRLIAGVEKSPQLSLVYVKMAEIEEKHIAVWTDELKKAGESQPHCSPNFRSKTLGLVARTFGPSTVLPILIGGEKGGSGSYLNQPEVNTTGMPIDEKSHERLLVTIAGSANHGVEGSSISLLEGRHRAGGGNALRASVLGANDGLVSVLSLVMGVVGAQVDNRAILITALAGILAGASSMAMGEWLSVQSSRELYQNQIDLETREIQGHPEEEMEELSLIYQAKGLPVEEAQNLAKQIISDPNSSIDTLAREELGIDPKELGGSAYEAAGMSFLLFTLGAIIPVFPFLFATGTTAVILSLIASTVGLFGIGAAITLLTGKRAWKSGIRQVLIGMAAAAVTFGIGRLIGVSVS
jgi:VIT1/CCC1 family predicted Fe2+/Mn2+ transporter